VRAKDPAQARPPLAIAAVLEGRAKPRMGGSSRRNKAPIDLVDRSAGTRPALTQTSYCRKL
jgi:hypothetical protein